jgi:hypothetical protein
VGVGWNVTGFTTIQRANAGLGTPRFDASEVYLLDGQELVSLPAGQRQPQLHHRRHALDEDRELPAHQVRVRTEHLDRVEQERC